MKFQVKLVNNNRSLCNHLLLLWQPIKLRNARELYGIIYSLYSACTTIALSWALRSSILWSKRIRLYIIINSVACTNEMKLDFINPYVLGKVRLRQTGTKLSIFNRCCCCLLDRFVEQRGVMSRYTFFSYRFQLILKYSKLIARTWWVKGGEFW
jgi:hypothetical protein